MSKPWSNVMVPHRTLHTGDRGADVQRFQVALRNRSGLNVTADGEVGPRTLVAWRAARWLLGLPANSEITIGAQRVVRWPWTRTMAAHTRAGDRALNPNLGAYETVERAVRLAQAVHSTLYVVSDYRPGDPMDHGSNDFDKAARDIAHPKYDALKGPPQPELDDFAVVLGHALGRDYDRGERIVDTWHETGWRLQVIWRTPEFGGHLGHVHFGIKED